MKMKQEEKWQLSLQLASMVVVVVLIFMADQVTSQRSDINSTLIRYYCSLYRGSNEKYFISNLNTTLSRLRWQLSNNRVHYASARTLFNGEPVWGLAWCRGYVSWEDCLYCFDRALAQLKVCGLVNGAHAIYNDCSVRYDSGNFYTEATKWTRVVLCGNTTSTQPTEFRKAVEGLLSDLRIATPRAPNVYAASTRQVAGGNATVYAFAQCNLNISQSICEECLKLRYSSVDDCLPRTSGSAVDDGCLVRYSRAPFFGQNQTTNITPLLWDDDSSYKRSIFGGVGGGVSFLLLILAFFLWRRRSKTTSGGQQDTLELNGARNYNYKDLQRATNNFSEENILGKGGFGEVFKAMLDDKTIVAVKKLQVRYAKAIVEFENEVKLIRNVHHGNLLRLLGWSNEGSNPLLVLEYMPNGSLDRFLWGKSKLQKY